MKSREIKSDVEYVQRTKAGECESRLHPLQHGGEDHQGLYENEGEEEAVGDIDIVGVQALPEASRAFTTNFFSTAATSLASMVIICMASWHVLARHVETQEEDMAVKLTLVFLN